MPELTHRPFGIEHPYATSADQRVPVRPELGSPVRLGVLATDVAAVRCEWAPDGESPVMLDLAPAAGSEQDRAALAGGDGHLAQAQAAQLADDGGWEVTSPTVTVPTRYRFVGTGAEGEVSTDWFEVLPGRWGDDGGSLTLDGPVDRLASSVQWWSDRDGVHRVRFALRLEPGEHVVGFGERFDAVDQRGRSLDAVVFEQYKSQAEHGRTYLPMPFAHVIGGEGWGFHVRTARRTWFDVGSLEADQLMIEAALSGAPHEELTIATYSGTPSEVTAAFTAEVGRAEELPDWVLGLWASGNEWNTQAIVMAQMDQHAALDLPVDVVVIEAWSDEEGIRIFRDAEYAPDPSAAADFSYPPDGAWPDPAGMIEELHRRGIKVLLWQIPLLKTAFDLGPEVPTDAQVYRDGEALVAAGFEVKEADGSSYHNRGWWFPQSLMADLSTAQGRAWWTDRRRYLVRDLGVDGFKTDGGEHAWGHDLRYGDGSRGDEGNNRYPVHYARAFGDLLRSEGKAPVTFSRAGFTGSQAHGVFWAGDENSTWEAFRASVRAGITASACGIVYWGWDLAGFSGPVPDAELYRRAVAASAFMPVMQYHSEFNHHRDPKRDRTPWWVAEVNDEPEVVEVFRRYATLRRRLRPYLAASARESVTTGVPLMRGLFVEFGGDEQVWQAPLQFTIGADLLVNPVTSPGADVWRTYLPRGSWIDAWTGAALDGGAWHERPVTDDVVPVYARAESWPELREVFAAAPTPESGSSTR